MNRVVFLVDGFNLYHALKARKKYYGFRWLDLKGLCTAYVSQPKETLEQVYYFTALCPWDQRRATRHKRLIDVYSDSGIVTIYGQFRPVTKYCTLCRRTYRTFEEKLTDVNIATKLFELAVGGHFDTCVILSGDSDLVPAVKAVRASYPSKRLGVILPIGGKGELLKSSVHFRSKMSEGILASHVLPLTVKLKDGRSLSAPAGWL